jgi:hypothetical protein
VIMDSTKPMVSVTSAHTNVATVHRSLLAHLVPETESHLTNATVQTDTMTLAKPLVQVVITNVAPVKIVPPTVSPVLASGNSLPGASVHPATMRTQTTTVCSVTTHALSVSSTLTNVLLALTSESTHQLAAAPPGTTMMGTVLLANHAHTNVPSVPPIAHVPSVPKTELDSQTVLVISPMVTMIPELPNAQLVSSSALPAQAVLVSAQLALETENRPQHVLAPPDTTVLMEQQTAHPAPRDV